MTKYAPKSQSGFTIIELMVATMVFSVLLVIITTGVLQFTRQYYKGVISASTQNSSRAVMDDVVRALQFSKAGFVPLQPLDPSNPDGDDPGENGYCIGDGKRYSFKLNAQLTANGADNSKHQSRHALVSNPDATCTSTTVPLNVSADPIPTGGRELLAENMRLVNLSINDLAGTTDTYTVTVRVLYGDDDLICAADIPANNPGGCLHGGLPGGAIDGKKNLTCKASSGSQFCAVSELSTVVKKRIK